MFKFLQNKEYVVCTTKIRLMYCHLCTFLWLIVGLPKYYS